jgi:hypothetical protein
MRGGQAQEQDDAGGFGEIELGPRCLAADVDRSTLRRKLCPREAASRVRPGWAFACSAT